MESNSEVKDQEKLTPFDLVAFSSLGGFFFEDDLLQKTTPEDESSNKTEIELVVTTFLESSFYYGFYISEEIYKALIAINDKDKIGLVCMKFLKVLCDDIGESTANGLVMYPNFPQQVMEASDFDLFLNAIINYWSNGTLLPEYIKQKRLPLDEVHEKVKIKNVVKTDDLKAYFLKLLASKSSLTAENDKFVDFALEKGWYNEIPSEFEIPFKQLACKVAYFVMRRNLSIDKYIKTTTDILRLMAYASGGDVTLEKKIKFKSFPRRERRILIQALDNVIKSDDVKFYVELWKLAFHSLHVGEYKHTKIPEIAHKYRNENNVTTYDTQYCEAIKKQDSLKAADVLKVKPSIFARNLDKVIRDCISVNQYDNIAKVMEQFDECSLKIGTKVLLQLLSHFQRRKFLLLNEDKRANSNRLVQISGKLYSVIVPNNEVVIPEKVLNKLIEIIENSLVNQFKERHLLKGQKVFISNKVDSILLPLQLSSASTKKTLAKGSKISMLREFEEDKEKKNVLRFFVHWIGNDIDLSALILDEDFNKGVTIGFTLLRDGSYAWHSGDIVFAPGPEGASEYIDIDIEAAINNGKRYVALDVRDFTRKKFSNYDVCFGGVMIRESLQSGEIYEPSTVKYKFDLTSETISTVMFLFDLKLKEMIWIDSSLHVAGKANSLQGHSNSVRTVLQEIKMMHEYKVSIGQLVRLHAKASDSEIVDDKSKADFTVSTDDEAGLNVYDVAEINSNWI
ncbi:uncharacterized protein RJT21DRAFT_111551 [Scheffersomyces amazonensis]|uniref:uncharacterized protein n=1 Tax=Scheffersomyces amazonensis TaxID=1078765 RepID=UPI00315D7CBC